MFFHSGSVSNDSEDDSAFMALSISMTTRIDSDIVDAVRAASLLNISHPTSGKARLHWWKWVCESVFSWKIRSGGKKGVVNGTVHLRVGRTRSVDLESRT